MNAKERVKRTIKRQEIDKIPYSFDITTVIKKKLGSHYGVEHDKVHDRICDNLKYVYYTHPSDFEPEKTGEGQYRDEFGVIWNKGEKVQDIGDWGGIVSAPLKEPDLTGYKFPDPYKTGRFSGMNEKELLDTGRYIVLHMDGVLDVGWHIRGFENLMMDFAIEEDFVNELLDKVLEFNLGIIETAPAYIDGIRFGEDWGQQKGLLMGGRIWRTYLKPRLKIMYDAARKRGFNVLIHTCGDITELFPDLIEMGVEVVHPLQPEVVNVAEIKRNYGKDIVLYGGLGCQSTIPLGTAAEVIDEARRRLELLGKDGGYIFGPAGAIPTEAKIENVIALVEYAMNGYKNA